MNVAVLHFISKSCRNQGIKKNWKKNPHWFINCMFFEKELEIQDRPYACNFFKKFEYDWSLKHIISSHTKF